ncbi:MAG: hypothetical protein SGJ13_06875 [Actinomycetota bacterium]|nr:hypothetical protein [Actinomycetota bacterium]
MLVRDAVAGDLPEILALVRELAEYEREPDAVQFDADEFGAHRFGPDAVASALIATAGDGAIAGFAELRTRTDGRVEWSVLDWNTPAQAFYLTLGAEPMAEWTVWRWPPRSHDA